MLVGEDDLYKEFEGDSEFKNVYSAIKNIFEKNFWEYQDLNREQKIFVLIAMDLIVWVARILNI